MLLSLSALTAVLTLVGSSPVVHHDIVPAQDSGLHSRAELESRKQNCRPVRFAFQVTVPYVNNAQAPPALSFDGWHLKLPKQALSGRLISFLGNFVDNSTASSQITTVSESSMNRGGSSFSNATATANSTTITAITFANGNASSAAGSGQDSTGDTSTASTGAANSTAVATADALGVVTINTNATVADATDAQSLQNERAAAAATSCAANNDGASASAQEITTVKFKSSKGTNVTSVAFAMCQAGLDVLTNGVDSGSSAAGSQASITSISANVVCNGVLTTNLRSETTFSIVVRGRYCKKRGFLGAITGQRTAETEAMC